MEFLTKIILVLLIILALIHMGFAVGEIFFGEYLLRERFGYTSSDAEKANPIVQNAGIYNSFIAAGLFWSVFAVNQSFELRLFFLICVAIAGIFGAMTLPSKEPQKRNLNTLYIQTIPAIIGILLVLISQP